MIYKLILLIHLLMAINIGGYTQKPQAWGNWRFWGEQPGGTYRGDRIGIFCFNNKEEKGEVDIDYFHYRIEK